jgi:hypothetical protein
MSPELEDRLKKIEETVNLVYASVEKTRKYFLTIVWVTVLALVLPAIGLIFAIPAFLSSYATMLGDI